MVQLSHGLLLFQPQLKNGRALLFPAASAGEGRQRREERYDSSLLDFEGAMLFDRFSMFLEPAARSSMLTRTKTKSVLSTRYYPLY